MCTSEPTSDSSDTGGSGKSNSVNKGWDASSQMNTSNENGNQPFQTTKVEKPGKGDKKKSIESTNDDPMKSDNVRSFILH